MPLVEPIELATAFYGRRAAQYVRMSTKRQKYSIENQAAAIAAYAASRVNVGHR
jgi:predicted site-specific integrase-resolvase